MVPTDAETHYKMILLNSLDVWMFAIYSCEHVVGFDMHCIQLTKVVCMIVHNHEIIQWLQCDNKLDLKFLNFALNMKHSTESDTRSEATDANLCFSTHRWFQFTHFGFL